MKRQALVIGLGQFGMSAARTLALRGVEVLAVDANEDRVRAASDFATDSACFDATDDVALGNTSPERRDVCLCAIGEESREASIICTALLRQFGAERVIARAADDVHARILRLVGAHQVVFPEREFGERFVSRILYEDVRGELPLGEGLIITEIDTPESFLGTSLSELKLPSRFGVLVVAIRREEAKQVEIPDPESVCEAGDILVVVSRRGAVPKMMEEV